MITADLDLVPDDPRNYRVAIIESFRRRGIYPRGVRTLSTESVSWSPVLDSGENKTVGGWLRRLEQWGADFRASVAWNTKADRFDIFRASQEDAATIHGFIFRQDFDKAIATKMGLQLADYIVTEAGFGSDLGAEKFFKGESLFSITTTKGYR